MSETTTSWGRCTAMLTDPSDEHGRFTRESIDAARCPHVTRHVSRRCRQHRPERDR